MSRSILGDYQLALAAEHIKKKGTGIYALSATLGLLFPAVLCIFGVVRKTQLNEPFEFSYYLKYIQDASSPFTNFFFPLLIIVITSRIAQLDHRNGGWQLMETQPVEKMALYFAKFSIVLIACVTAIFTLISGGVFFGWILSFFIELPDNALMGIPWRELLQWGSRLFVAALYIAALQYIIAVLLPSFIWSILIGFGLLLAAAFAKPYGYNFDWYPYHILSRITDFKSGSDLGHWFVYTEYASVIAAVLLLYIGYQWYRHKAWKQAFLSTSRQFGTLAAMLALGGVSLFLLLQPKSGRDYPRTILAGELDVALQVDSVYVINTTLADTLAVIPVTDNRFHYVFTDSLIGDYYSLAFDRFYRTQVYFGQHDSVYVKGRANANASEFKILGTRLADNRAPSPNASRAHIQYYLQQNMFLDNPGRFAGILHADWKRKWRETKLFKTVDNRTPKVDFNRRSRKLVAVNYLNYWTTYVRKRQAVYPDESTPVPAKVLEIQHNVALDDESLLSEASYRQYVVDQFALHDTTDTPQQEKALAGIANLPRSRFRDKLLYWQLAQSLEDATDSTERTTLIAQYRTVFVDSGYHNRADQVYQKWQRLGKGRPAPSFAAVNLSGQSLTMADLKGQPVVIDVWATWCGPCKQQSPYFERLAIKYKDKPIHFVALSVDRDKRNWDVEARTKSKSVQQWFATDMETFGIDFNVPTIPRFILVDAEGKFAAAEMPMPSESAFELIIRKELGLPD